MRGPIYSFFRAGESGSKEAHEIINALISRPDFPDFGLVVPEDTKTIRSRGYSIAMYGDQMLGTRRTRTRHFRNTALENICKKYKISVHPSIHFETWVARDLEVVKANRRLIWSFGKLFPTDRNPASGLDRVPFPLVVRLDPYSLEPSTCPVLGYATLSLPVPGVLQEKKFRFNIPDDIDLVKVVFDEYKAAYHQYLKVTQEVIGWMQDVVLPEWAAKD